mmetsp:Transcript_12311/g.18443  ORF Transcript_12311/g.18443 Transcript_12311/m.18443 type:complete len:90 (+) Transcript_12311:42-311(+)
MSSKLDSRINVDYENCEKEMKDLTELSNHNVKLSFIPFTADKWWQSNEPSKSYFAEPTPFKKGYGKLGKQNSLSTALTYHQHLNEKLSK